MPTMKKFAQNSALNSANAPFVEEQYAVFLNNPADVGEDWQIFFRNLQERGELPVDEPNHKSIREEFNRLARSARHEPQTVVARIPSLDTKQVSVLQFINAYRFRGHQHADIDPLVLRDQELVPELHPAFHKTTLIAVILVLSTCISPIRNKSVGYNNVWKAGKVWMNILLNSAWIRWSEYWQQPNLKNICTPVT
jgi:2-oxoglutarate dehydrogenase complex dehydrogenase (E1) component-like enzyme